ncbi:CcmD family protein [Pedobacter sp. SAFR-022]|uniref:CcmD family protein n=1 Tax=Pedobacter sp. SAFR-022 TaxID=3436861 RepID=UPI003F7F8279
MKKILFTLLMLTVSLQIFAQGASSSLEESIYASGKIYVVVACAAIILIGLILFLFSIDRRLKKLEKYSDPKN